MQIGISKEVTARNKEIRAILLPREVKRLIEAGHKVLIEKGLGARMGIPDSEYSEVGASVTRNRNKIFTQEIVIKLKPPVPEELR